MTARKGLGNELQVGFAKEGTRGTAEAAATFYLPFQDAQVDDRDEKAELAVGIGVIESSVDEKIVKQFAEISVKGPVGDKIMPLLLLGALGGISTGDNADSDASVKDHTITVAQSAQHQALTVFLDDPLGGQDYKHAMGCVENLELSYEQGKFIEYALKAKAKKGETATLTPATTAENYFLPQHFSFKLATALTGLDAASATVIKSLKLKISKKLEEDYNLGSIAPTDFLVSGLTIEGELEAVWQNESDFKTAALAGTQKAMRIDLKNADVTIGSAAKPEIKIDLAKVIFSELTRPFKVGEIVKQSLSFKAHYSITDSKSISIVCTNNTASY